MTLQTPKAPKTLQSPDSRFAQIDGTSVHYKLFPPTPIKTLLICLHGFGASLFSFTPLLPHLTTPTPTLLAYDAPGFGLTERPRKLSRYGTRFSSRIAGSLAQAYLPRADDRFAILAHSMGALAAVRLVLDNPQKVSHLILIAPALLPAGDLPNPLQRLLRFVGSAFATLSSALSILLTPLLVPLLHLIVRPESFWRAGLRLARHPSRPLPEHILRGYREPIHAEGWERGILNFSRAALMDRAKALKIAEDFVGLLGGVRDGPRVLVVHGDSDGVVPLDNSVKLIGKMDAELVVMKNCGHVPHEEDPEMFCRVLMEFLGRERG